VQEGVNPREPMVRRRGRYDGLRLAESWVDLLVPLEEARDGRRADRNVTSDDDIAVAQFARHDLGLLPGHGIFDPQQVFGQLPAKAPMDLDDRAGGRRGILEPTAVNPCLDGDMGLGLELEVALARV